MISKFGIPKLGHGIFEDTIIGLPKKFRFGAQLSNFVLALPHIADFEFLAILKSFARLRSLLPRILRVSEDQVARTSVTHTDCCYTKPLERFLRASKCEVPNFAYSK